MSALAAWHFGVSWQTLAALFFIWSLISLSGIDLKHQLLPDDITLPLLWLGLFVNLFGLFCQIQAAVIGAIAGYLFLWIINKLFKIVKGIEGKG